MAPATTGVPPGSGRSGGPGSPGSVAVCSTRLIAEVASRSGYLTGYDVGGVEDARWARQHRPKIAAAPAALLPRAGGRGALPRQPGRLRSIQPFFARYRSTSVDASPIGRPVVSMVSSAPVGGSYGSSMPVMPVSLPDLAFA